MVIEEKTVTGYYVDESSGHMFTEYVDIKSFRNYHDQVNIEAFLEQLGLKQIEDFIYFGPIGGGKASLTAIYKNNDTKCVIKFLVAPRHDDEYQSFVSEYAALKQMMIRIQSFRATPKIVIDFSQHNNIPIYYFGMEYIEGKTLLQVIEENPLPWRWNNALDIIHRIAMSLSEIHVQGFAHRDLHPGNILLTADNDEHDQRGNCIDTGVRILDLGSRSNWMAESFGLEPYEDPYRPKGAITSWSPEYLLKRSKGNNSPQDTWSLGIILFRLLTGSYPIEASNISELIYQYQKQGITINWSKVPDNTPDPVWHLLKRMLEFDSNKRIATGPITRICYDVRYRKLLDEDEQYIQCYLSKDGQVDDPLDYIY